MSEELKPCPFCGGPASIHKGMQAFDDFEVHCDPCGICGPNFGSMGETLTPKEDAIAAWNTRTDLAEALVELIAAYEDIMDYGIVFAKKDQQDRLNAAKEKFAAIRAIAALPAVTVPVVSQPVRYCPICDIADCATHREPAAIREAALREAAKGIENCTVYANQDRVSVEWQSGVRDAFQHYTAAILALIAKGAAE